MKALKTVMLLALFALFPQVAGAIDFFGATVTDQEVRTMAWNTGVMGFRPTVGDVSSESAAARCGLKRGHVILAVNGKNVKRCNELGQSGTEALVEVLDGMERKTLKIKSLPVQAAKAEPPPKIQAVAAPQPVTYASEQPDDSPPVVLDDNMLDREYGITSSKRGSQGSSRTDVYDKDGVYGGKTIGLWVKEHKALGKEVASAYYDINSLERKLQNTHLLAAYQVQDLRNNLQTRRNDYKEAVKQVDEFRDEARKAGIPYKLLEENLPVVDPMYRTRSAELMRFKD